MRTVKIEQIPIERVQLGVRMERSMVKVLKAMAEYGHMSLGELLEADVPSTGHVYSREGNRTLGGRRRFSILPHNLEFSLEELKLSFQLLSGVLLG